MHYFCLNRAKEPSGDRGNVDAAESLEMYAKLNENHTTEQTPDSVSLTHRAHSAAFPGLWPWLKLIYRNKRCMATSPTVLMWFECF